MWNKLKISFGLDSVVSATLLNRSWNMLSGLITIFLVANTLTPALQGYYYTFNSLLALQLFVELGLVFATIQFASHEMVNISLANDKFNGDDNPKGRLKSILIFTTSWLSVGSILLFALLILCGYWLFAPNTTELFYGIYLPWISLSFLSCANLVLSGIIAFLEGCGELVPVARFRLRLAIGTAITIWLSLSWGLGLYALTAGASITLIANSYFIVHCYGLPLKDLFLSHCNSVGICWKKEIWPFQWRIALSWLSGYFISNIINPLAFALHGPVAAGQVGMSMQIFSSLNNAALAWITTKAPLYGQFIARKDRVSLDILFFRGLRFSTAFLMTAIISVVIFVCIDIKLTETLRLRLLEPTHIMLLAIVALANHYTFSMAAYMRAHKEEPLLGVSILNGIATTSSMIFLSNFYGIHGLLFGYTLSALTVSLGGVLWIFFRFRQRWSRF